MRVVYPALQSTWLDVDQKVKPTSTVKTFGSISRLVSRKGHDVILQALGELKQDFKFRYLIGGIGPEEENLRQLVKTLNLENNVVFLGKVAEENLIKFYDSLDVYIMLNRIEYGDVEGFGYSFAEAAARYIPSIGGANGGAVEAISANGGFLVDTEDLDQVKDAIISYIKSDRLIQEHGINANMFCRRNFSLEKMVNSFLCEI